MKKNKHLYVTSVKTKFKLFCPLLSMKNTDKVICFYLNHCLYVSFHIRDLQGTRICIGNSLMEQKTENS